jgi:hypothetical protein
MFEHLFKQQQQQKQQQKKLKQQNMVVAYSLFMRFMYHLILINEDILY